MGSGKFSAKGMSDPGLTEADGTGVVAGGRPWRIANVNVPSRTYPGLTALAEGDILFDVGLTEVDRTGVVAQAGRCSRDMPSMVSGCVAAV